MSIDPHHAIWNMFGDPGQSQKIISRPFTLDGVLEPLPRCDYESNVDETNLSFVATPNTLDSLIVETVIVSSVTETITILRSSIGLLLGRESEEVAATRLLHRLRKCFISADLNVADGTAG